MVEPFVSIIVPIYEAEAFLPRCIDSVLSQTYTKFELILVDDGSPDNSGRICDEFAKSDVRIKVLHKLNGGVGSARNVGLDVAIGEYIVFIDADDFIRPQFLEHLLGNSDADLTICSVITKYERHYLLSNSHYQLSQEPQVLSRLINDVFLRTPWGKLFKREIIERNHIRFDNHIRFGEDTVFVLTYLLDISSLKCLSEELYCYSDVEDNFQTRKKYNLSLEEMQYMLNAMTCLIEAVENKFDFYIDRQCVLNVLNTYPIEKVLADYDETYLSVCRKYTNLSVDVLYNDWTVSPILRGIVEIKDLYLKESYSEALQLAKLLRQRYSLQFDKIKQRQYGLPLYLNLLRTNLGLFHVFMKSFAKLHAIWMKK